MTEKKKKIYLAIVFTAVSLALIVLFSLIQYRVYLKNYNNRLNMLVMQLSENFPEINPADVVKLLGGTGDFAEKGGSSENGKLWAKYGIDLSKDSVINENRTVLRNALITGVLAVLCFCGIIILFFYGYERRQLAETRRITGYLERINRKDYTFDMNEMSEGEQSILENEVYKTTVMLREAAEQSRADKENLKDSLSDISHQLKTPLTSMMINLDNLKDHPDMDTDTRNRIVSAARRDAVKMQKMIAQFLTLSRLDANVIKFTRSKAKIIDIVRAAAEDVEALADLRNIEIVIPDDSSAEIMCDSYWETEAVGNILKNGIEHASSRVSVCINDYELYREIVIENDGVPISEQDRKNIFRRFYQGESAGRESAGIGLSLAQVIVKNDGGYIVVESDENAENGGTRFIIRY